MLISVWLVELAEPQCWFTLEITQECAVHFCAIYMQFCVMQFQPINFEGAEFTLHSTKSKLTASVSHGTSSSAPCHPVRANALWKPCIELGFSTLHSGETGPYTLNGTVLIYNKEDDTHSRSEQNRMKCNTMPVNIPPQHLPIINM